MWVKNELLAKQGDKAPLAYHFRAWVSNFNATSRGRPSCDILLDADATGEDLVDAVLDGFKFDNDHLHLISDNLKNPYRGVERYGMKIEDSYDDDIGYTSDVTVAQIFNTTKKKMMILFDFGDEWLFLVQLIEIRPLGSNEKLPSIVGKSGTPPVQYEAYDEDEEEEE